MLVRKVDGAWTPWTEPAEFTETLTVCDRVYHDGRIERDVPCDPYTRTVSLDPAAVENALSLGAWSDADLAHHELARPVAFVPPAGKRAKGSPRYEEQDGAVHEVFDVEDLPTPAPLTKEQKVERLLASFGLTKQDVLDALKA